MKNKCSCGSILLNSQELAEVLKILKSCLPNTEVWAFGSRVTGGARKFSDLDIAVISSQPLPLTVMADLKEAFSESDLIFKVDIVDWAVTSEAFRRIIKEGRIVLQSVECSAV